MAPNIARSLSLVRRRASRRACSLFFLLAVFFLFGEPGLPRDMELRRRDLGEDRTGAVIRPFATLSIKPLLPDMVGALILLASEGGEDALLDPEGVEVSTSSPSSAIVLCRVVGGFVVNSCLGALS